MSKDDELRYGPPGGHAIHLCVDMQRMFAEGTDWKMAWLPRVLPNIVEITCDPERTIFTRFFPAGAPGQGSGMWRRYYERWSSMTISIDFEPRTAETPKRCLMLMIPMPRSSMWYRIISAARPTSAPLG